MCAYILDFFVNKMSKLDRCFRYSYVCRDRQTERPIVEVRDDESYVAFDGEHMYLINRVCNSYYMF